MPDSCRGCGATTSWETAVDGDLIPMCTKCLDQGRAIVADPKGMVLSET